MGNEKGGDEQKSKPEERDIHRRRSDEGGEVVQSRLRERAREERSKENIRKVGYRKIKIGNNWYL